MPRDLSNTSVEASLKREDEKESHRDCRYSVNFNGISRITAVFCEYKLSEDLQKGVVFVGLRNEKRNPFLL